MTRMDCSEVRDLLHAHDDGELASADLTAVDLHVKGCPECAAAQAEWRSLRTRLRQAGTFAAPPGLRGRVEQAVGSESRLAARWSRRASMGLAASYLLIATLAAGAGYQFAKRSDWRATAARETVTAHVRSLLADQVMQVTSADSHIVKPWFSGRVPFAPDVVNLAEQGFPLLGGRTDYIFGQTAAVLVYGRRQHRINVFLLPADRLTGSVGQSASLDGYHVVGWRNGPFAMLAVSDLNDPELQMLANLLGRTQ